MKRKTATIIFLGLEAALYIAFLSIKSDAAAILKYAGVVLCFAYTFLNYRDWTFLSLFHRLAFLFTLLADLFLLLLDNYYVLGVIFFVIVQLCRFQIIHFRKERLYRDISIIARAFLFVAVAFLLLSRDALNILYLVTAFYFINLVVNFVDSLIKYFRRENNIFAPLGFLLFIACDVCVGLANLAPNLPFVSFGMWFFYLPSQVLLALSAQYDKPFLKK